MTDGTPLPDCRICGELWALHHWSGDAFRCRAGGGGYAPESSGLDRIAELRQKLEVLEAEKAKLCKGVFTMWHALTEARAFSMRGDAGEPWHGANTALRKSGAARVIATDAREAREHRRPGEQGLAGAPTTFSVNAERGGPVPGAVAVVAPVDSAGTFSGFESAGAGQLETVERGPSVFAKVEMNHEGERAARAPEEHATGGGRCDAVCSCGHPCHMHADRERCTECECVAFRTEAGDR